MDVSSLSAVPVSLELSVEFGEAFSYLFREISNLLSRFGLPSLLEDLSLSLVSLDKADVFQEIKALPAELSSSGSGSFFQDQLGKEEADPSWWVSSLISSLSKLGEDEREARETLKKAERARVIYTKKLEEASRERVRLEDLKLQLFRAYRELQQFHQSANVYLVSISQLDTLAASCVSRQKELYSFEQSLQGQDLLSSSSLSNLVLLVQEEAVLVPLVQEEVVLISVPVEAVLVPLVQEEAVLVSLVQEEVVLISVPVEAVLVPVPVEAVLVSLVQEEAVLVSVPVEAVLVPLVQEEAVLVPVPDVDLAVLNQKIDQEVLNSDSDIGSDDAELPSSSNLPSDPEADLAALRLFNSKGCSVSLVSRELGLTRGKLNAMLRRARTRLEQQST
ncbi:MAG: hypothetical protein WCS37_03240 [Chloroflexota bacterium]|nr:hypothetical protein [Chloroflexota bacterium]